MISRASSQHVLLLDSIASSKSPRLCRRAIVRITCRSVEASLRAPAARRHRPTGDGRKVSSGKSQIVEGFETATLPELRRIDDRGAAHWYEKALELAREEQWESARKVFQATTLMYPNLCRAWVSWAQVFLP